MKKIYFHFILSIFIGVFTTGCGDANFDASQSDTGITSQGFSLKGEAPHAIAAGGLLQNHSVRSADYQENLPMVESLIGQPIGAKVHKKNGIMVSIGYPDLQAHFFSE